MTKKPIIAVAGCGHWGKNLVRNFYELSVLGGICDNNETLANEFSKKYDVPAFTWDELISNTEIDAVVIASPAPFHFEMASAVIKSGKDVYVEKPITLTNEDATALCELAKKHNQILMVGHLLQYHPAYIKLKELVHEKALGKIHHIYSNRMSFGKIRREENVLWSFAPHDVSMILGLANEAPVSVEATGHCQTHPQIADLVNVQMQFPSGITAHISVSWINPFKEQKLVVIGDKGMVVFDDQQDWDSKLMHYPHVIDKSTDLPNLIKKNAVGIALESGEPLKMECQHFIESIRDHKTPRTDGEEGLRVLDVLNRAEQSMQQKLKIGKAA